jgi:hypothetical protein
MKTLLRRKTNTQFWLDENPIGNGLGKFEEMIK